MEHDCRAKIYAVLKCIGFECQAGSFLSGSQRHLRRNPNQMRIIGGQMFATPYCLPWVDPPSIQSQVFIVTLVHAFEMVSCQGMNAGDAEHRREAANGTGETLPQRGRAGDVDPGLHLLRGIRSKQFLHRSSLLSAGCSPITFPTPSPPALADD